MARWTREGRAVDIGAAYFTVRDGAFAALAEDWARRGLAHPWTDTFHVADADGVLGTRPGPTRWSAEDGLRSLVEDMAVGLDLEHPVSVESVTVADRQNGEALPTVDGQPATAVVLAMPEPQALDLLDPAVGGRLVPEPSPWRPALVLVAGYRRRAWPSIDGVFVADSDVELVVDDGRRRGDHAPVLVARSTPAVAAEYLDDPDAAIARLVTATSRALGIRVEPQWTAVRRWSLAQPAQPHAAPFAWVGDGVGICGDAWGSRPRVEAAYLSGSELGRTLVARLG